MFLKGSSFRDLYLTASMNGSKMLLATDSDRHEPLRSDPTWSHVRRIIFSSF